MISVKKPQKYKILHIEHEQIKGKKTTCQTRELVSITESQHVKCEEKKI